ncbi:MAG TPA: type II secretion system F family protein [Candidatus Diapherotrites archaeon]|uniref:Type II secretion system F family protein n=1 Tax=Candidatus Iainarchaeum sp. TaxID=3101447 RepID=A0A7J4IXW2_9ARCH|nr:type II secretion system F family protein [Candidatus Diapherotrites archaeon]
MISDFKFPFCPLPSGKIIRFAGRFRGMGSKVARIMPNLAEKLRQSELGISPEDYGAVTVVMATAYFVFGTFVAFAFLQKLAPKEALLFSPIAGLMLSALIVVQYVAFPAILLKKKVREVERNLVFALRTILVEIKAGVTLFDSINIVAEGDNGQVSKELKKAVEKIETGAFQNEALDELAENNPSIHFRRAIWQLVNGLKAGSDVSIVMQALVEGLTREKENQVRKYGNSLKLLSLLYMMLGAIIPALGLTFLIILSTFPQIAVDETMFWGMLGFIVLGQFMYLGIIKSSRPTLIGD